MKGHDLDTLHITLQCSPSYSRESGSETTFSFSISNCRKRKFNGVFSSRKSGPLPKRTAGRVLAIHGFSKEKKCASQICRRNVIGQLYFLVCTKCNYAGDRESDCPGCRGFTGRQKELQFGYHLKLTDR